MTNKDEVTLQAAALVAAEIVTAERTIKAGGTTIKVPKAKARVKFWIQTLNDMAGLDPYLGDWRRGQGGVTLSWTIWAMTAQAANAPLEEVNEVPPFAWDMAYTVTVRPKDVSVKITAQGDAIEVDAFGEECSDLGSGRYSIHDPTFRSTRAREKRSYPGLADPRGDFETTHMEAHRRALQSVLDQIGFKGEVEASAAAIRK